jgi:hypothetical protein
MPILRYTGHPKLKSLNTSGHAWCEGDEHEVTTEEAERLTETFVGLFTAVGSAPVKPPKTRAVSSPKRGTAPSKAKTKKGAK